MTRLYRIGYALLIAGAALPAFAGGSNGVQLSAAVDKVCVINTGTSTSINLTGVPVNTAVTGTFNYQCNFAGGNTTLRVKSSNGGIKNGTHVADYGIFLHDQSPAAFGTPSPMDWLPASVTTVGLGVPLFNHVLPAAPNTQYSPNFLIGLTQPANVAGLYQDTLTITINP